MKKKQREITINGEPYVYSIKNNVDGDGGNRLTIIKQSDKSIIKYLLGGDYPNITPSVVKELILNPNPELLT